MALLSSDPAPGATGVAPDASLSLRFSTTLSAGDARPTLNPAVPGTWIQTSPGTLAFEAAGSLPPGQTEQISVPGGANGILASDGLHLAQGVTVSFKVAPMPTLRLQQLLAELDYLPLSFTPSDAAPIPPTELATQQLGSFAWRWNDLPSNFLSLWSPGQLSVIVAGAVMTFESQHQLSTDGEAGPQVWQALMQAAEAGQMNTYGHYDFVEVYTSIPEHLSLWRERDGDLHDAGQQRHRGGSDRARHLACLRVRRLDHHVRHEPGRQPLQRPQHSLGKLLPRGRRPPRFQPVQLRHTPELGLH